jgi:hypothetical protein
MLQKWLLPQMNKDFIFQQGGAPPHWHEDVRCSLNQSLPQRWIGRIGNEDLALLFWPPRSPDLTHCDFFLWVLVKEAVYVPSLPSNLDDLKNRFRAAVSSVTQDNLFRVWDEISYRLDVVLAAGRGHIEYL